MDRDTLQMILRKAVRETTTEVLQILLDADREAFLRSILASLSLVSGVVKTNLVCTTVPSKRLSENPPIRYI